jgi:hypothetical protein
VIIVEMEELAVEGADLVADLFEERLQARTDAAGMGEAGELVEVDTQPGELSNHRQSWGRSEGGNAPIPQEMAQVGREVEGGGCRTLDGSCIVLWQNPYDERPRHAELRG